MRKSKEKVKTIFSKNVVLKRKELRMSQAGLAKKTGLGLNTIKSIEGGVTRQGNVDTKERIARALDCTVNELSIDASVIKDVQDSRTAKRLEKIESKLEMKPFTTASGRQVTQSEIYDNLLKLPQLLRDALLAQILGDPSIVPASNSASKESKKHG